MWVSADGNVNGGIEGRVRWCSGLTSGPFPGERPG